MDRGIEGVQAAWPLAAVLSASRGCRCWTRIHPAVGERSMRALAAGPLLAVWQPVSAIIWSVHAPVIRCVLLAVALAAYMFATSLAVDLYELLGARVGLRSRGRNGSREERRGRAKAASPGLVVSRFVDRLNTPYLR